MCRWELCCLGAVSSGVCFLCAKLPVGLEGRSLTGPPVLSCGGHTLTSRGLGRSTNVTGQS